MPIRVLSENVVNQIAAGEVVERPVSVVRELVDNSLDAGASEIAIVLEAGGRNLISVSDNGSGMSKDDVLLAFERHATSKISKAEDLIEISTLGFRGEALPAISSISRMMVKTKVKGESIGTVIRFEGGILKSVENCSCAEGTEMTVANLFFNTPARRKFLKEPRTELSRIKQWILRVAMAHPRVHFKISNDGQEVLNLPARKSMLDRAALSIRGSTLSVDIKQNGLHVQGLLAHPAQAQADANALIIIVNGRVVSDRMLLKAAREGFDSMLKFKEFPLGLISITLNPRDVDVNVHPQKSEVRFRDSQEIFITVRNAVLAAVNQFKSPVPSISMQKPSTSFSLNYPTYKASDKAQDVSYVSQGTLAYQSNSNNIELRPVEVAEVKGPEKFRYSELKYVGQLFNCYLLCQFQEDFVIVDMHAAHERCNFNLFRNKTNTNSSQELLIPVTVNLTEEGVLRCLDKLELFESHGFKLERFGEDCVSVRAAQPGFSAQDIIDVVKDVASTDEVFDVQGSFRQKFDSMIARRACHASIRSGYIMNKEEVYSLFDMLDANELSAACPHGRPVIVQFPQAQVESWFGRDR